MQKYLFLSLALLGATSLTAAETAQSPEDVFIDSVKAAAVNYVEARSGLYANFDRDNFTVNTFNLSSPHQFASICDLVDVQSPLLALINVDADGIATKKDGTRVTQAEIEEALAALHEKHTAGCALVKAFLETQATLLAQPVQQ